MPERGDFTILIVDDEEGMRLGLKKTLSLDSLLSDDSTFFGDLFAHVVQYKGVMYLEDRLHLFPRCGDRDLFGGVLQGDRHRDRDVSLGLPEDPIVESRLQRMVRL